MSMCLHAQNASIADYGNGDKYAVIEGVPVSNEYSNVRIFLRTNKLKDFVAELRKKNQKVEKWTKVAQKENVTDIEKSISGSCYFAYMTVEYQGNSYWIEGAAMLEGSWMNRPIGSTQSQTGRPYCRSIFKVDKQGNCYLVLVGEMTPQKFKYGNISMESTTASVAAAADNNGNAAVGAGVSSTQSIATITLQPNFNIWIPADNVDHFATQLEDLYDQLVSDKKDQKKKKKLFK